MARTTAKPIAERMPALLPTRLPRSWVEEAKQQAAHPTLGSLAAWWMRVIAAHIREIQKRGPASAQEWKRPDWSATGGEGGTRIAGGGFLQHNVQLPIGLLDEVKDYIAPTKKDGERVQQVSMASYLYSAMYWFRTLPRDRQQEILGGDVVIRRSTTHINVVTRITVPQAKALIRLLGHRVASDEPLESQVIRALDGIEP